MSQLIAGSTQTTDAHLTKALLGISKHPFLATWSNQRHAVTHSTFFLKIKILSSSSHGHQKNFKLNMSKKEKLKIMEKIISCPFC
jgi:hypothetical protein